MRPIWWVALAILLCTVLGCVIGPLFLSGSLTSFDYQAALLPPSLAHPMGTDPLGVDELTEVLISGRTSLLIGGLATLVAMLIGGVLGGLAGFLGGVWDEVIMRVTDIALSVPLLFVLLFMAQLIGRSPVSISIMIALASWMYPARIMRAQVLSAREREYVESAYAVGASRSRVLVRHLLPNAVGPVIVNVAITVGLAITTESIMSFLGVGISPPASSWGYLLNQAQTYAAVAPWLTFFPGFMIFLVVLSVNLLGDALRDVLDPRAH